MDSGYGYGSLTELTEVSGIVAHNTGRTQLMEVPRRYSYKYVIPVPRVLSYRRTYITEVPGRGMNVMKTSQKFRERVLIVLQHSHKFRVLSHGPYTPHRSSAQI